MIFESNKEIKTIEELQNNQIISDEGCLFEKSTITFKGKGNILYIESPQKLDNSVITFGGDNALVYISENRNHVSYLKIDAWRETTAFIGKNNFFSGTLSCVISERKNIIIGSGGVFSFGIWIRTADPHLLYSIETGKRINPSKSVWIGDHVWLGQNCMLLKGTRIGSGSVIAAGTVVANKSVESNSVYAGNPARKIRSDIFFRNNSVHNYTETETAASMEYTGTDFIYENGEETIDFESIDHLLSSAPNADERLYIVREKLVDNKNKNRFFNKVQGVENEQINGIK